MASDSLIVHVDICTFIHILNYCGVKYVCDYQHNIGNHFTYIHTP